jgi:transcriptional regulator with XRE-family HTH domain
MPATSRFGRLLRDIRKQAGLSQRTLAASLCVDRSLISRIETGRINPPLDSPFYDRLRAVSGFSVTDITLLREAAGADKSSEDLGKLLDQLKANWQSIRKILESRLRNPQPGSSIEVRRKGLVRKSARDLARVEDAKFNEDLATLLARISTHHARLAGLSHDVLAQAISVMSKRDRELPAELQAYGALLTELIAQTLLEAMVMHPELPLRELVQPPMKATQAAPSTGEDVQAPFPESFTDADVDAIISALMPSKEEERGDYLTKHVNDLQSQGKLGSERREQPSHYPHENVVFHVAQLQAEALRQQGTKKGSVKSYEIVASLRDAAERTGVADDEILTTSEIEAEYHLNKKLVHEYTKRGRQGRSHLTPLAVRLVRGGGSPQLLFRRGDIERIVANPPKTGRPPK